MKYKWSILIEYDAKNIKEFEEAFYNDEDLVISKEWVKGILFIVDDYSDKEMKK